MNQSDITAPILSYDDINKHAEDFLRKHKRNEIFPVDIEAIAEFDLGLNIFPFPNLQETFVIEGFIYYALIDSLRYRLMRSRFVPRLENCFSQTSVKRASTLRLICS